MAAPASAAAILTAMATMAEPSIQRFIPPPFRQWPPGPQVLSFACRLAAAKVLRISQAMVMGPTPRHRRDEAGDILHRLKIHVTAPAVVGVAVDAHVDDDGAGLTWLA